jgi:hypothetical protein
MLNAKLNRCKAELTVIHAELDAILNQQNIDSEAAREAVRRMMVAADRLKTVTRVLLAAPSTETH